MLDSSRDDWEECKTTWQPRRAGLKFIFGAALTRVQCLPRFSEKSTFLKEVVYFCASRFYTRRLKRLRR